METPVYDRRARWAVDVALGLTLAPVIFLLTFLRTVDPKVAGEFLPVLELLIAVFVGLFLVTHVATNVWVRIDPMSRKVFQLYKLSGWAVYQKAYDLSQFERISLHRAPRGGYRATLVGRDREVVIAASWKLDAVRRAAEQTAGFSSLKLSDQL